MKLFNSVKRERLPRSRFDLSHRNIFTPTLGELFPCNFEELVPGDKIVLNTEQLIRCTPLKAPVYQDLVVNIRHFVIPHRLMFPNFDEFVSQNFETDNIREPYTTMYDLYKAGFLGSNLLPDYFGVPSVLTSAQATQAATWTRSTPMGQVPIRMYPFIAYWMTVCHWYFDSNLESNRMNTILELISRLDELPNYPEIRETDTLTINGTAYNVLDNLCTFALVSRVKDYFTSAQIAQQKGQPLPIIGGNPYVVFDSFTAPTATATEAVKVNVVTGQSQSGSFARGNNSLGGTLRVKMDTPNVVELRTLEACQKYLERTNLGGSRFIEFIRSVYGVNLPDAFAQRVQYIGGSTHRLNISEIVANTASGDDQYLGDYAGMASLGATSKYFGYTAKEHCFVLSLFSIIPMRSYYEGISKVLTRISPYDIANPIFARVGEQEIKSHEFFFNFHSGGDPDHIFGYTPRYADFKCHNNEIHGLFRSTLDFWHASPDMPTTCNASDNFECTWSRNLHSKANNPDRIFSHKDALDSPNFRVLMQVNFKKTSSLPYYGEARI